MLTHDEAKIFYDSFGKKQDKQFYDHAAINTLLELAEFNIAKNIIEFGCGTGKLAARILKNIASNDCHYTGIDISQTMVSLCKKNIEPFSNCTKCYQNDGAPNINVATESVDRFVSTYVLDLLTNKDIKSLLNKAYRTLFPGGYLCLASLTHGVSFASRIVEMIWNGLYKLKPSIVGGCRPINLTEHLPSNKWVIMHDIIIISYAVPSEILIAKKIVTLDSK